jgi:hypothetical protein
LNAAVHAGRSSQAIALQANWASGDAMVLKYTRNRRQVPLEMIKGLVSDLKEGWVPKAEGQDDEVSEQETDHATLEDLYYIKTSLYDGSASKIHTIKYHIGSIDDPERTACKRLLIVDCTPVGTVIPDSSMVCASCEKQKLFSSYQELDS